MGDRCFRADVSPPEQTSRDRRVYSGRMVKRPNSRIWTPEEISRLQQLADSGATLLRAAAALGRQGSVVQRKARECGKEFPGVRKVRAGLRASGAINAE
jgi:hypothetical protein